MILLYTISLRVHLAEHLSNVLHAHPMGNERLGLDGPRCKIVDRCPPFMIMGRKIGVHCAVYVKLPAEDLCENFIRQEHVPVRPSDVDDPPSFAGGQQRLAMGIHGPGGFHQEVRSPSRPSAPSTLSTTSSFEELMHVPDPKCPCDGEFLFEDVGCDHVPCPHDFRPLASEHPDRPRSENDHDLTRCRPPRAA